MAGGEGSVRLCREHLDIDVESFLRMAELDLAPEPYPDPAEPRP